MKVYAIVALVLLLSGCLSTGAENRIPAPVADLEITRIEQNCATQAFARSQAKAEGLGAYIATAENAEVCLGDISFSTEHPDNHQAMQLQALAVNSYLNAGDITSAKAALRSFREKFPLQDLVFDDFTSFVDTATALTEHQSLSNHQLERLNINPTLRAELLRQQRWLTE